MVYGIVRSIECKASVRSFYAMMLSVVYGAVKLVGRSIRLLDVGLYVCLKLSLMLMAWLGDVLGVDESRGGVT